MAATASALLEWQPLFVLEKENYQLREENRHLHFQVHELMAWKEKALHQMVSLGPKRQQAQRDVQQASKLQKQLRQVEKSLNERSFLDDENHVLKENHGLVCQQVSQLENENTNLQKQVKTLNEKNVEMRDDVQKLADQFRFHLEQLVAMREQIDGGAIGGAATPATVPEEQEGQQEEEEPVGEEHLRLQDEHQQQLLVEDPSVLISGLSAVSEKCLRWFQQHVAQTFSKIQEKAVLYESQHLELQQLRQRVQSIGHDVAFSVAKEKQQAHEIVKLQSEKNHLQMEIHVLRKTQSHTMQGQSQMSDHVRLLVTEVRQYLRLVRSEIKKKFGYVPEAITHAESWTRILDAMDVLERQLRMSTMR